MAGYFYPAEASPGAQRRASGFVPSCLGDNGHMDLLNMVVLLADDSGHVNPWICDVSRGVLAAFLDRWAAELSDCHTNTT